MTTELEIWADSFKEGEFLLDRIAEIFPKSTKAYIHGFIPTLQIDEPQKIKFVVYGYYKSWENIPEKISVVLENGKPDGIIYDPKKDKIIFAYEETSAVPTGNQSHQRLERVWFAAIQKIPFVYLLGQYGLHKDGNTRKVPVIPAYLGLKLSTQYSIPSLTLLYGSKKEPENYLIGNAVKELTELIRWYLFSHLNLKQTTASSQLLLPIFSKMCKFINTYYSETLSHLPGDKNLTNQKFHKYIYSRLSLSQKPEEFEKDFKWNSTKQISKNSRKQQAWNFTSHKSWTPVDPFIKNIDLLYKDEKVWTPFVNSGVMDWSIKNIKIHIKKQNNKKIKLLKSKKIKSNVTTLTTTNLSLKDLNKKYDPKTKKLVPTMKRLTHTKAILTLVDSTNDFLDCIENTYGKQTRQNAEKHLQIELPTTLWVTSSIVSSGRAYNGDPFTGQSTAYSKIFSISLNGKKERNMVAYYPNQLYSQFFDLTKKDLKPDNKGKKCAEKNIDLIIPKDGILINPKTWSII